MLHNVCKVASRPSFIPALPLLLATALAMQSCRDGKEPEQPAGGPCSYRNTVIPARLIAMYSAGPDYELLFKLDSNALIPPPDDTISYYMEQGHYLPAREADSLGVAVGKYYTYLVRDIESGHCSPQIRQLLMQAPE